jgi:2-desacetyl-2-hydroxyethyl bacteriochlorophyllide A dehydrogenase
MRAFRIYSGYEARYEELPDPLVGPGDVLLRVKATAVCGTDLEIYQGTMFYFTSGMARYPIVPGHEWAAEILAVGSNVTGFRPGDKVVGECTVACGQCEFCRKGWYNQCSNRQETGILHLDGGFADTMSYPCRFLHKFEGLSFEEAALCETTAVGVYAAKVAAISPSDQVAVLGPGPIGLQVMQAAKAYGAAKVVMIGGRRGRRELARQLGADAVIDPKVQDLVAETLRLTDGRRFDVVLEATGNPAVTRDFMRIIRPRGRIVLVGLYSGQSGSIDLDALVVNDITLRGALGSPNVWDETISLLQTGRIHTEPLISVRLPLRQAEDVFRMMEQKRPDLVKAVLLP